MQATLVGLLPCRKMLVLTLAFCFMVPSFACRQTVAKQTAVPDIKNTANMSAESNSSILEDNPVVTTPSGSFRGTWMETRRGRRFEAYRGIRYAEAPVGKLRFQPPKPILHYDDEVDATEDGPACPQPAPVGYYIDEDCLTINVYTPSHDSKEPLPVIFFIHAGGYYSMSGRSDLAGPHYLLDRDIVLVTINYRIGSLGFLSTGDAVAPGNNGFKDQVVALRWVQRNILSFGGDPNLVTIAGCSAGSSSVLLHMVSPMSQGLFHRGISISGSPITKVPLSQDMLDLAQKQAQILNCPTNSSEAIVECLKTKSAKEMGDSLTSFYVFGSDPLLIWSPIVEPDLGQERFLTMEPMEAIRKGKMHAVPFIISRTTDEFFWKAFTVLKNETLLNTMNDEWERIAPISFALPPENSAETVNRLKQEYFGGKRLVNDESTAKALGNLYGDTLIGFPVHRMANLMCRHSPHKVFYYEFAYIGDHSHYEDPVTKKPTAAAHHDDLIYLFTLSYQFPTIQVSDSKDSQMVDKMTAVWSNFAKYGDPNPRGPEYPELSSLHWPPMTPTDRQYLRFGDEFSVHENLFEDRMKTWEELYSVLY